VLRRVVPVLICGLLGGVGVWQILGNGGVLGWLLAGFLLLGARFHLRPGPGQLGLIAKLMGALVLFSAVLVAGLFVAWETAEVVVLRYTDERQRPVEARLWVIDLDGHPAVATGSANRRVALLQANPEVELARGDRVECRRAVLISASEATPEQRQRARRLFEEKYGLRPLASRTLALFFGAPSGEEPVLFRLEPCPQP
jgi:hypothetical protein